MYRVGWTEDPIKGQFLFSELRDVHVVSFYIDVTRVSCRSCIIGDRLFQECNIMLDNLLLGEVEIMVG